MKTTYFKPSIHGWPFGNSFKYSFLFGTKTLTMGFCGGMCWRSLQRFYSGTCIPRSTQAPSEGDALYDEIFDAQKNSLPIDTLWKILRWQQSPDLSHPTRQHSLGYRTQQEWPGVKDRLDKSQPVTLTLITSSNDYNLKHLENNHRVVAYAYDVRDLYDGEGAPSGADSAVTILIYDPNYPNDDDVCLTFYLGGDDSNIRLRHNRGDDVHGFFLDDKDRSYAFADSTMVRINKCEQTGISSATMADYDLEFSWQCRFTPYFCVLVDGSNWNYNNAVGQAKLKYDPTDKDNKQCLTRTDSITVNLKLPRARAKVAVRLLDTDDYYQSVEVDAVPAIDCFPYVRDTGISEADLFIKDPQPTQAAVQQLNTSPFRWIMLAPKVIDTRRQQDDLSRAYVEVVDSYRLGNIVAPIHANFVERNLAAPTQTSGVVNIFKNGQPVQTTDLTPLASQAQQIFDGFTNNPADYDNDTTVEFTYKSIDRFNVLAQGKTMFYGRSIIYQQSSVTVSVFDPTKVAKFEAVARDLIERGLIDIAIELPHAGGPGPTPFPPRPQPAPIDPVVLMGRLRLQRRLQRMIDQTLKALWCNPDIWKESWKVQSEILKQADQGRTILIDKLAKAGDVLKATNEFREAEQRKFDAVIVNTFVDKTIENLRRDPNVIIMLKSL